MISGFVSYVHISRERNYYILKMFLLFPFCFVFHDIRSQKDSASMSSPPGRLRLNGLSRANLSLFCSSLNFFFYIFVSLCQKLLVKLIGLNLFAVYTFFYFYFSLWRIIWQNVCVSEGMENQLRLGRKRNHLQEQLKKQLGL